MDGSPSRLLEITGRTRQYANVFDENVTVAEIERATCEACRTTGADMAEFMVAPRCATADDPRGGHEWFVEFRVRPRDADAFARVLDEALARSTRRSRRPVRSSR